MKYTIAIIDEESEQRDQFEFVFEKEFNVFKIDTFDTTENLINIIKSENIDAVAIDYRLTEHNSSFHDNGDFFFKEIRKKLLEFPVFILTRSSDEVKKICKTVDPSFIMDKENINYGKGELEKEKAFLESIKTKITVYKSDLKEKIDRLNDLEQIRKTNPKEFNEVESEYINLNFELSKYISGANLPFTYFTQASNERLDSLISKTEDILKKLDN
ncbi:response regulator [Flavobacterium sp. ACN6]|uniref:response regulator n=1 Tax=Flavobacterium sp. ACN6 TaxID=1920426 RepID=UPI000BB332D0|nr:response regulator [Flavobacterium sp. ACN6]PBJ12210.1 hypothetical protein BSF42_21650 [Flavobacterium sp. ACN6]